MISSKPNRLIAEKSPYLLQHAYNPVDWYPWGEEAFDKARREDKPILLSIGYSTCHWCHVMERESFSNQEIASLMNRTLVCIKLDREERPDLDKIYMTAAMSLTGSGGWPLNVFLTTDLKPFFGGTYFPPQERWGRISWPELVKRIGQAWQDREERKKILESSARLADQLKAYLGGRKQEGEPERSVLGLAFIAFRGDYDSRHGGFGEAPKFPMPVNLNFLGRYHLFSGEKASLEIFLRTLKAMACGGIYDQIGGGFHRYSTDESWHVPHFEKMLYDNAQIALNYLEAYQITQEPFYAEIAEETLDYLLRDMSAPEGGFYSAEDADSLPQELSGAVEESGHEHKKEGAFYLWEQEEIYKILGSEKGKMFCEAMGVRKDGNAKSDLQNEFKNKNILYRAVDMEEFSSAIKECREKLLNTRNQRPRPQRDDKILSSWNGLALSAFSRGYQVLGNKKYLAAAEKTALLLRNNLYETQHRELYRRWRGGEKKVRGIADDYVFLAQGLLDLYESGLEPNWLSWALELSEETLKRFYDSERGGFYMTEPGESGELIPRVKEDSDNVEPSASSVAVMNFLRLGQALDREDFLFAAEKTLRLYTPQMREQPRSLPQMLSALTFYLSKPCQIVITGRRDSEDFQALLKETHSHFIPNRVLLLSAPGKIPEPLLKSNPFLSNLVPEKNTAQAFVCYNRACELPVSNPSDLKKILDKICLQTKS